MFSSKMFHSIHLFDAGQELYSECINLMQGGRNKNIKAAEIKSKTII